MTVASENELQRDMEAASARERRKNGPAKSTMDAFHHLRREGDMEKLARWIEKHPEERGYLVSLTR